MSAPRLARLSHRRHLLVSRQRSTPRAFSASTGWSGALTARQRALRRSACRLRTPARPKSQRAGRRTSTRSSTGRSLSLLNAYIAPLSEVQKLCGGSDVLGCYGDNHLVIPDQTTGGVAATSIAAHEYGHHVANNRLNPPWRAIDWGTKRWATALHVCERAAAGTAFPGAENGDYPLNPGEAFAESYRVLNETALGLPAAWPILDPSFRPDAAALDAIRQDVLDPWTAPTATTRRVRFAPAARIWTERVATPLDGSVQVSVQPGSDDVTLLAADTRAPLARGAWTPAGAKTADLTVCGQRTFLLRVTRHSSARRFTLRLSAP